MLNDAIDSFEEGSVAAAKNVTDRDDVTDLLHQWAKEQLSEIVKDNPEHLSRALCLQDISADIERIANPATNIAEEAIFVTHVEIVRRIRV